MSILGEIKSLFTDRTETTALFPRTKTKAVSDDSGVSLDVLLDGINTELDGKAPAGFGFGGRMTYIDMTSDAYSEMTFEEALETVLATMSGYSCAQVQFYDPDEGYSGNKFIGKLWKYTANYVTLEAINYNGYKAIKRKNGGTWQPWEWENPPMTIGVEYRTIEKYEGKVVYVKKIDLGTLPSSGQKSTWYFNGSTNVWFEAYLITSSGNISPMPYFTSSGTHGASVYATEQSIVVCAHYDISAHTGFAIVHYTKD